MSGERWQLVDGMWRRKGWAPVAPGAVPVDPSGPPPPATGATLRIAAVELEAAAAVVTPPPPGVTMFGVGINDQQHTGLETSAGVKVGFHRTYFTWGGMASSIPAQAASDKSAGRVPVMSTKLPVGGGAGWVNCANGDYDDQVVSTVNSLVALNTRVILAFHHEPDNGDGPLADFRAMQAHLVPLVNRGLVELWTGFTGYHQLYGSSEWKLPAITVPGVKGHGYDPYQSYLASSTSWTDHDTKYYQLYQNFHQPRGLPWGIWETGLNEQAAASGDPRTLTWVKDRALGSKTRGADHWIYWDNEKNPPSDNVHNWRLTTTGPANKRAQFITEMQRYAL